MNFKQNFNEDSNAYGVQNNARHKRYRKLNQKTLNIALSAVVATQIIYVLFTLVFVKKFLSDKYRAHHILKQSDVRNSEIKKESENIRKSFGLNEVKSRMMSHDY